MQSMGGLTYADIQSMGAQTFSDTTTANTAVRAVRAENSFLALKEVVLGEDPR